MAAASAANTASLVSAAGALVGGRGCGGVRRVASGKGVVERSGLVHHCTALPVAVDNVPGALQRLAASHIVIRCGEDDGGLAPKLPRRAALFRCGVVSFAVEVTGLVSCTGLCGVVDTTAQTALVARAGGRGVAVAFPWRSRAARNGCTGRAAAGEHLILSYVPHLIKSSLYYK